MTKCIEIIDLPKFEPFRWCWRLIAVVACWHFSMDSIASAQGSVFYDITLDQQFAGDRVARPATLIYHAYPWLPREKKFGPAIEAAAATRSKQICFDYEPWAFPEDHPQQIFRQNATEIDPHRESIEEVQRQHQLYGNAIASVRDAAKQADVKIGIYSFLSLHHRRLSDIGSNGREYIRWRQQQQRVLSLPIVVDGSETTLLALLNETGGAVWVPWYVPNQWNSPRWKSKVKKVFGRLTAEIEKAGGKAIPILNPNTIGGDKGNPTTVLPEIQRDLVRMAIAQHPNQWSVWAKPDQVTPEFRKIIHEELRRSP